MRKPKTKAEFKALIEIVDGHWLIKSYCGCGAPKFGNTYAASYVYRLYKGAVPEGRSVSRDCDSKYCLNPDHLRVFPKAEIIQRSAKDYCDRTKFTGANQRLTSEQIGHIRKSDFATKQIMKIFNISRETVYSIRHKKGSYASK